MVKSKKAIAAMLVLGSLALGTASAETTTYVFPYEGFRYTQQEGETVLTQTNLHNYEDLLETLGTTPEAVLASYLAGGIVMEVLPDEGGQIAVSVTDAGDFADVAEMSDMSEEQQNAFVSQFADSGLYETCILVDCEPKCVRITSSAMYASMPVYTVRYATLHLGKMYLISKTIVGRTPEQADDEQIIKTISEMKLLSVRTEATPAPTAVPTPTPEVTPKPTSGVAEIIASEGTITVEGVPSYTNDPQITLTGTTDASAQLTVTADGESIGTATAKKDGTYSLRVNLPHEGEITLAVMSETAQATMKVLYEMPEAGLEILEPTETVFTGTGNVTIRGITTAGATIHIEGKGASGSVKAANNGAFTARVTMEEAGAQTYRIRSHLRGYRDSEVELTLVRELTEREGIAEFRRSLSDFNYAAIQKDPARNVGRRFNARGKVMTFMDYDGSPCALVCTDNPGTGIWNDPVWIILPVGTAIDVGTVKTFYFTGEGLSLPAEGTYTSAGVDMEAPVVRAAYIVD